MVIKSFYSFDQYSAAGHSSRHQQDVAGALDLFDLELELEPAGKKADLSCGFISGTILRHVAQEQGLVLSEAVFRQWTCEGVAAYNDFLREERSRDERAGDIIPVMAWCGLRPEMDVPVLQSTYQAEACGHGDMLESSDKPEWFRIIAHRMVLTSSVGLYLMDFMRNTSWNADAPVLISITFQKIKKGRDRATGHHTVLFNYSGADNSTGWCFFNSMGNRSHRHRAHSYQCQSGADIAELVGLIVADQRAFKGYNFAVINLWHLNTVIRSWSCGSFEVLEVSDA
ncbi:hypothetical protein ACWJJH_03340 [Endozoicomonadaceae bacterium StTr2]